MLRLMAEAEAGVRLVAIVDPARNDIQQRIKESRVSVAKSLAIFDDVDAFLDGNADVDAIILGTRCLLHTPIAIKLAPLGLPLFFEKPVAIGWQ